MSTASQTLELAPDVALCHVELVTPNVPAQRPPAKDVFCDEMDCRGVEEPDFTMDDLEWSEAYE